MNEFFRRFLELWRHITGQIRSRGLLGIISNLEYVAARWKNESLSLCHRTTLEKRERYSYTRLETPQSIRVVELLPARLLDSTLRFNVHHTSVHDQRFAYTAVSYAWGKRKPGQDLLVECDGRRAYIPPTLHSALVRIREQKITSQFIWADALCIDQADDDDAAAKDEKSAQVSMMDQIFAHAREVIVDLGELRHEDRTVLSILDHYGSISEKVWTSVNVAAGTASVEDSIRILDALQFPAAQSAFWKSFQRFICRPWFTRVWIIQEFALACSPQFMIGRQFRDAEFLPNAVARAAQHLGILYIQDSFYGSRPNRNTAIADAYFYVLEKHQAVFRIHSARTRLGYQRSLCELLDGTTLYFEATDPRDRVYALLGLSDDENIKQDLYVDYKEAENDFAIRVSLYLSRRQFGIYPLYHCVGDVEGYVSWAMNLTNTREGLANLIGPSGYTKRDMYSACGPARFVRKMSELRVHGLTVRGWILDTITLCMERSMPHDAQLKTPRDLEKHAVWQGLALDWMLSVSPTQPQPEDEFVKTCWRTVIVDLVEPSGGEGHGYRRLRDWSSSDRCINTVDRIMRVAYKKWKGDLPESYTLDLTGTELNDLRIYAESFSNTLGRKLALSKEMRTPCVVPYDACEGDNIVIIQGCQIPFVLRRRNDGDGKGEYFRIVGCAYVHGIMDGETVGDGSDVRDIEIW